MRFLLSWHLTVAKGACATKRRRFRLCLTCPNSVNPSPIIHPLAVLTTLYFPFVEDIEENGLSTTNNQNNSELSHANIVLIVVVSLTILLLVLAVALIICCMRRNHEKKMKKLNTIHFEAGNDHELMGLNVQRVGDSTLREYKGGDVEDSCMTSGSGSGALRMVQRSLARNIQLLEPPIGKGRYGEVYKGIYAADYVAVKIFFSRDEESFKRETRIYELDQMRHEHILGEKKFCHCFSKISNLDDPWDGKFSGKVCYTSLVHPKIYAPHLRQSWAPRDR